MRLFTWGYRLVTGILAVFFLALSVFGLFRTVMFRQLTENDYPDFHSVPTPAVVVAFLLIMLLLWAIYRHRGRGARRGFIVVLVCITAFCLFLLYAIRGIPTNDARILDEVMRSFRRGDYSAITDGYLSVYPFQLSYVLAGELISAVFGEGVYLPYQLLNVLSIVLTLICLRYITEELFPEEGARLMFTALSPFALMLYAYSTFIYNDIWSLAPLFAAMYSFMVFLRKKSAGTAIATVILTALSYVIKNNGAIVIVAMVILLFVRLCRDMSDRRWRSALSLIAMMVCLISAPAGLGKGIEAYYTARTIGGPGGRISRHGPGGDGGWQVRLV